MALTNLEDKHFRVSTAPASSGTAINYSSGDQTFTYPTRAIFVGGAGNLVVQMAGDSGNTTFTGIVAGSVLPIQIIKVVQSGSSATNAVALF
tara:strand:- start:145 stop:420 length:276 start_codon:yes stop_codon:yes gene_type:complete